MGNDQATTDTTDRSVRTLAPDNDYQTELPRKSVSAAAAADGEAAVMEARRGESGLHVPVVELSPHHAREKAEALRAKAYAYNLSRSGRGADTAPYRNLTNQADLYGIDATNVERANASYEQLVVQAALSLDSVVRFVAIKRDLGVDFSDNELWTVTEADLTHHVADRKDELAAGLSQGDVKTQKGLVAGAARRFAAAQAGLFAALAKVQAYELGGLQKTLEGEVNENVEKKEKIERAIEKVKEVTELITTIVTAGGEGVLGAHKLRTAHESWEKAEGAKDLFSAISEPGATAAGFIMHAIHDSELAELATKIRGLRDEVAAAGHAEQLSDARAIADNLDQARQACTAAAQDYENAIASRRTSYAKAGHAADRAHGGDQKGNDKASQTMLYVSAARETTVVLENALPIGQRAENDLHETLAGMRHRSTPFLEDDWQSGQPEGQNGEDREHALDAYGHAGRWVDATKQELVNFKPIEEASRSMLAKVGRTSGEY